MKLKMKLCFTLLIVILIALVATLPAYAKEEMPTSDSYVEEILDALPEDVVDHLPEGNGDEIAKAADEDYLLSVSVAFMKNAFSDMISFLVLFLGVILVAAFAEKIETAFGKGIGNTVSYLAVLLIAYRMYLLLYGLYDEVFLYVTRLEGFMSTLATVMGSISFLGGGVTQGTVGIVTLTSVLTLLGGVITALLLPIIQVSFAANLTFVVSKRVNLSALSSFLRNFFTYAMGFLAMLAVVVLTFQTVLAGAEDTLAARSIRFAASSAIPIVGGAVSDSVKTLAASVSLVKKSVGTVGMTGLMVMTLYPLSQLFSANLAISLSKVVSGILGVSSADLLLDDAQKSVHMLMATVSIMSILFIFATALFAFSAVPLEGAS